MRAAFYCCLFLFCFISLLSAQDRTGVWRGVVSFSRAGFPPNYNFDVIPIMNAIKLRSKVKNIPISNDGRTLSRNPDVDTKAKLEWIQIDNRAVAQLTSYSEDNHVITMYQFDVRPTPKEFYKYHLQAKSLLVNETDKKADLFDLRGSFHETDSVTRFYGVWESPFGDRRYGTFLMENSSEPVKINPELVHSFLKKNKIQQPSSSTLATLQPTQVFDTLYTNAISLYANLVDNGIEDQDTLSIWFNGVLLEDNVVPGKKPFFFRVNLSDKEWNQLTIRCKHEGKEKGSGIHLNMQLNDSLVKYNLVLYEHDQADWIIRRKIK